MTNRTIGGVGGERLKVHNHAQLTTTGGIDLLPNLPANEADIRRVVIRPKGDISVTLDGSDPTGPNAMYVLKDEVITLDTDGYSVRISGAGIDVRFIYLGA